MDLTIRFDYGHLVPWVTRSDGAMGAVGGPDAIKLSTPVESHGEHLSTVAEFAVSKGDRVPFVLTWHPSHRPAPPMSTLSVRSRTLRNGGESGPTKHLPG